MEHFSESERLTEEAQDGIAEMIHMIFKPQEQLIHEDETMNDDDDEEEPKIDLKDQDARTMRLESVLSQLGKLWDSGYERIDKAIESVANGSRDPRWRIPVGESGILYFALDLLGSYTLPHSLKVHILRLIGNSCADTDENRARVVSSYFLPTTILKLKEPSLLPYVIPVLYNICLDYEPAQKQASESSLGKELIDLISSPTFNDNRALLGYTCKILDLLITQPSEVELAPENSAVVLLNIAADREVPCDVQDFVSLVTTAIAYLQHEKFQKALVVRGALDTTFTVLVDSYTRFNLRPTIGASPPEEDEAKILSQMGSNLNQVLSDVSALPEFRDAYPVVSPFSSSLRGWLSDPQLQLQVCACIMLGNLARSDSACEEFIHTSQVHKPLISILTNAHDAQLLHAAIGFLKNLALPIRNKEAIGNSGVFEILPRLWALDTLQQIQFSSISLARQLVINTDSNARRLCARLSEDPDSPAHMRSNLSLLLALFNRTDVEPTKMEISRLMLAVCRVVCTSTSRPPEDMERIRKKFFSMHPEIGGPLGFMVSQTKWPALASEAWFVFALMARHPEGAEYVSGMLHDAPVFRPLVEVLTGENLTTPKTSSPSTPQLEIQATGDQSPESASQVHPQAAEMSKLDRQNALVLVSELLKNGGSQMAVMRRTLLEDLLKSAGERVLSENESASLEHLEDPTLKKKIAGAV